MGFLLFALRTFHNLQPGTKNFIFERDVCKNVAHRTVSGCWSRKWPKTSAKQRDSVILGQKAFVKKTNKKVQNEFYEAFGTSHNSSARIISLLCDRVAMRGVAGEKRTDLDDQKRI